MRKLRLVLTDNCNFKCPCCYNEGNKTKNKNNYINFKEIKQFLRLTKGSFNTVVLTGGEPLLYPKFNKLIKFLKNLNMEIQLTTNGSLLHAVKSSTLKKINKINVSFDSVNPNCFRYNWKTSPDLYEQVKKNIVDCSFMFNNVILNSVIDKDITETEVAALLDFVKMNGIKAIKFIPLLDCDEEKCLQNLQNILFTKLNLSSELISNKHLIYEYDQGDYSIYILRQYCNNSCDECKQNSFVRINWDGKIYPCRKNLNKFLKVEDLIKEKNNQKIIKRIEEVFSVE